MGWIIGIITVCGLLAGSYSLLKVNRTEGMIEFNIGVRENFCFKRDNKMYFSEWHEDPEYREEINIREYSNGKLLEKIQGAEMMVPNGQRWILR